jgi:hypothetical protein
MSKGMNGQGDRQSVSLLTPVADADLEMASALQLIDGEGPLAAVQVHVAKILVDRGLVIPDELFIGAHLMTIRGVEWLRDHSRVVKDPDGKLRNFLVEGQEKT